MNLKILENKKVWITGASSGIGRELAVLAATGGAQLFLFSSRKEPLTGTADICMKNGAGKVYYEAVDLSDESSAVTITEKTIEKSGPPDFLILNAGISQRSKGLETSLETTRKIMELNFFASAAIARTAAPAMIASGGGHIGITSSVTGIFGFPLRTAYAASKHALHGYFESLGMEYSSEGLKVTILVPGRISTDISRRSLLGDGSLYNKNDPGQMNGMDVKVCAQKYWKAVIKGKREKVIGKFDIIMVYFYRYIRILFFFLGERVSPV
jgi:short-subunit dehydrogenase